MKKFNLHFGGFYCSIHESIIDSMLESYFMDDDDEIPDYDSESDINYQIIFLNYSKVYLSALETVLNDEFDIDIKLHFKGLTSPREYNYSTDTILTSVSNKSFDSLFNHFSKDNSFIEYVNEYSRSRSGFISFFEGIENVLETDYIFLEYLSKYLISEYEQEIYTELDMQNIHELLYSLDFYTKLKEVA